MEIFDENSSSVQSLEKCFLSLSFSSNTCVDNVISVEWSHWGFSTPFHSCRVLRRWKFPGKHVFATYLSSSLKCAFVYSRLIVLTEMKYILWRSNIIHRCLDN